MPKLPLYRSQSVDFQLICFYMMVTLTFTLINVETFCSVSYNLSSMNCIMCYCIAYYGWLWLLSDHCCLRPLSSLTEAWISNSLTRFSGSEGRYYVFGTQYLVFVPLSEVKLTWYPLQSVVVIFEKLIISLSTVVLKILVFMFGKINMSDSERCMEEMDLIFRLANSPRMKKPRWTGWDDWVFQGFSEKP